MVSRNFIDLNPVVPKYYPFIVSLDKCTGSLNVLYPKIKVLSKTKDIHVKVFNLITDRNEAKTMVKHILCDCKWKSNSTTDNSNPNAIMKHVDVNVKIIVHTKRV